MNKIYRYQNTSYQNMWDKETAIIDAIRSGELDQALLLYQCQQQTLVLPAGKKWQATPEVSQALAASGWAVLARRSGGAPVPQSSGMINVSHFYLWPEDKAYSVKGAYEDLSMVLGLFFKGFGVSTQTHATPFSFCDGDYNVNIDGRKIVGTAQRVMSVRQGRKLVLAQACVLIDAAVDELVAPVNQINALHGYDANIRANAHTCLSEHVEALPSTDVLYSKLTQAFIYSGLYG
jgi:lipoate-protein ligase A